MERGSRDPRRQPPYYRACPADSPPWCSSRCSRSWLAAQHLSVSTFLVDVLLLLSLGLLVRTSGQLSLCQYAFARSARRPSAIWRRRTCPGCSHCSRGVDRIPSERCSRSAIRLVGVFLALATFASASS